jgi:hypothetical protein
MKPENALVRGSLADIASQSNQTVAETFLNADLIVLLDVSASMGRNDARGNRQRYDVACEELALLQADMPGRVAVIGFSAYPEFAPSGKPAYQGGNTDLAGALKFARIADTGDVRFAVISDGEPDSEREALDAAKTYKGCIDCIYIGPENDKRAQDFMSRLASAHNGKQVTTQVHLLAERIETLLITA